MTKQRVVVFGGAGFLGSHVADSLTDQGYDVVIFDRKKSPYLREGQTMCVDDTLNFEGIRKAIAGAHYVFNFSGLADLDSSGTRPLDTLRLNVEGTLNILEACREEKVQRFVYASSIYVYSEKGGFYRCSKQAAEIYIEEFQRRYDMDFTILRYGTVFGPRADRRNSAYRYLYQALTEKKISVPGDGEELREYIHVRDAADLSVKILDPQFVNSHLILTGHHPIKLKQLLETISEIIQFPLQVEWTSSENPDHYKITPYSYTPKIGKKLTSNCYTDLGQGLLECLAEIHSTLD